MRILIGADIVPTEHDLDRFLNGDAAALVGDELAQLLQSADYRIFNLETPLCDTAQPIAKNGPHLMTATAAISGYKALGANLLAVANNHIMDHDEQGLSSTLEALDGAGIAYVGAGSIDAAAKPYIAELGGKKIGIYACAEHEFSIATDKKAGANGFDPLYCPDRVAALKEECDYVIVLYHGGREFYRYPLPQLQRNCRRLAEKGADLVICQHTHCIGSAEEYSGGTIVYGQGNFIFDRVSDEYWNSGMLVSVELGEQGAEVTYIPTVKAEHKVRAADGAEASELMAGFFARSEQIVDPAFVKEQLKKEAAKHRLRLARQLSGNGFFNKLLYKFCPALLKRKLLKKEQQLRIYGLVSCESHREMLLEAFDPE